MTPSGMRPAIRRLNHIAGILTNQLKGRDLVSRWGGEEFLIYLPQTSQSDAALVAHILKNATDAEPPLIQRQGVSHQHDLWCRPVPQGRKP